MSDLWRSGGARAVKFTAAVALATALQPYAARAQGAPAAEGALARHVVIEFENAAMSEMLRELSHKFGLALVADGEPQKQAADVKFEGTLRDALDRVADAFDYKATVSKSGAVLMTKRFRDPTERPQVIPGEIARAAADVVTVLPPITYDPDPFRWGERLRLFATELSPEQTAAMKGGKSLALADFRPEQQAALTEIILLRAYGMAHSVWERIRREMERFGEDSLTVRKTGVFIAQDGHATAYFDVVFEARDRAGNTETASLGGFRREVHR